MTPVVDLQEALAADLGKGRSTVKTRKPKKPQEPSPAYQWYPRDENALEAVAVMDNETYGVFRRLYDHAWLNDGLPLHPDQIFVFSRVPTLKRFRQIWLAIEPLFPPSDDGRRRHTRQEAQRTKKNKFRRDCQIAAKKKWDKARARRTAVEHATVDAVAYAVAVPRQCSAFAFALSSSEQDPEQGEQRARRAQPARMVPVAERRTHLLAAVHKILDAGEPYLTADGPNIAEISAELKGIARKLRVHWDHSRELDGVINAALATRPRQKLIGGRR
jgi:hypothetical protein